MNRYIVILVAMFYCVTGHALTNLAFAKQELQAYYDSGAYMTEIATVAQQAEDNLIKQVRNNPKHEKLALVLDIDETSISNYADLKSEEFGGTPDARFQLLLKGNQPAILPVLSLYKLAVKEGVTVFFITGRPEKARAATEKMLKKDGYTNWAGTYFRTDQYANVLAEDYKTAIRKKITAQGFKIIESVGDQYSDLQGGYALMQYKLPNPFYYIP